MRPSSIAFLCSMTLVCASAWAAAAPPLEADRGATDRAARLRIQQEVPALLSPCRSIQRIHVALFRGEDEGARRTISDAGTIARICGELREAILQDDFQIGAQFHAPSAVRKIAFVREGRPSLRLLGVGDAMFWMSWNEPTKGPAPEPINFRSLRFDAVSDEHFRFSSADFGIAPDFSLQISRRGCEGRCPVYTARLDGQGVVRWNGRHFVAIQGADEITIDPWDVRAIVREIERKDLFSFQKTNLSCIDSPSVEIVLTMMGRSVSLASDACAWQKTPQGRETSRFVEFAEKLMQVGRWVR